MEENSNKSARLVTYGSIIHLNIEDDFSKFAYCQGFQQSQIQMKKFTDKKNDLLISEDFQNCLFVILPFQNQSSFLTQIKMINFIQTFRENQGQEHIFNQEKLSRRKDEVKSMITRLEMELNQNITNILRSQKQKILLINSNFMLLHLKSMKYVNLNTQNKEVLFLELIDFPTQQQQNCFFKFIPSLQLQTMRNDNFVYEDELLYICSSSTIQGKNPYLTSSSKTNFKNLQDAAVENVFAGIDTKRAWKLNLYEEPNIDERSAESHKYLRVGESFWLIISERDQYLSITRDRVPFQFQDTKKRLFTKNTTKLPKIDQDLQDDTREKLYSQVFEDLNACFSHIQQSDDYDLSSNGMWKIESDREQEGGHLKWDQGYYIRHVISAKYLSVDCTDAINKKIRLTREKNKNSLWNFMKIDNLMDNFISMEKIHQDSYFRLMNKQNNLQLFLGSSNIPCKQKGHLQPELNQNMKEIDTYKFMVANFQETWKIHFLIDTIPLFLNVMKHVVYIDEQQDIHNNLVYIFSQDSDALLKTIKDLQDFINNRMLSSMQQYQEYNHPNIIRQNQFKEQNLLGLCCQFLVKIFPRQAEFEILKLHPSEKLLTEDLVKLISDDKLKINQKLINHFQKRYIISYQVCQLIQDVCFQNQQNQLYFYEYMAQISKFIGQGEFISDTFNVCFKGNQTILENLHQVHYEKEQPDEIFGDSSIFQTKQQEELFLVQLIKRFKKYEAYTKYEILDLLSSFCRINDQSIYINQQTIFSGFIENRGVLTTLMFKIATQRKDNQLVLNLDIRHKIKQEYTFKTKSIFKFLGDCLNEQHRNFTYVNYFKSQLNLYCNMCCNRNYICYQNFSPIFHERLLLQYIKQDQFSYEDMKFKDYYWKETKDGQIKTFNYLKDDINENWFQIRALFAKLLLNIHINKEPRIEVSKPNFVRIFKVPLDTKAQQDILSNIFFNPAMVKMTVQKERYKKIEQNNESKQLIAILSKQMINFANDEYNQDVYKDLIEKNINDQENIEEIQGLIKEILYKSYQMILTNNSLKQEDIPKEEYNKNMKKEIYNELTLQIVRIFFQMFKFGMFNGQNSKIELLKDIFNYLAFMMEFDEEYFKELVSMELKRSFVENQNNQKKTHNLSFNFIDINFSNSKDDEDKDEIFNRKISEEENDDQFNFLQLYNNLLKLLGQQTNKTYTNKVVILDKDKDLETLVKIEICNIFNYLMDWREDILLDTFINYFEKTYYLDLLDLSKYKPELGAKKKKEYKYKKKMKKLNDKLNEDLLKLMPQNLKEVGEMIDRPKNYQEEWTQLDYVLNRPFMEVLILGFYFTNNHELQNLIMTLIQRCHSQKQQLIKNVQKVNLVAIGQSDKSYLEMSSVISKLKALYSFSQNWLQIIGSDSFNDQDEKNLIQTKYALDSLLKMMDENISDQVEIKQKILRHLDGPAIIMNYISQGTQVFQLNYQYFKIADDPNDIDVKYNYKNNFQKLILDTFRTCHLILEKFCYQNPKNQKYLFKKYVYTLKNQTFINIGQVECIVKIFLDNKELAYKDITIKYLQYMVNLIKTHGYCHQFLELFKVLLENKTENIIIQKNIINLILQADDQDSQRVSPFEEAEDQVQQGNFKDLQFYKNKDLYIYKEYFLQIVFDCLKVNVGMNYFVLSFDQFDIGVLLGHLGELTNKFMDLKKKETNQNQKELLVNNIQLQRLTLFESMNNENEEISTIKNSRINTISLILLYIKQLSQCIPKLKNIQNQQILINCIKKEQQMINKMQQNYDKEDDYILSYFIPLINIFTRTNLKDTVMISIIELESKNESSNNKIIYNFAKFISERLDWFLDSENYSNISKLKLESLIELAENFNIPIDTSLIYISKVLDTIYDPNNNVITEQEEKVLSDQQSEQQSCDNEMQSLLKEKSQIQSQKKKSGLKSKDLQGLEIKKEESAFEKLKVQMSRQSMINVLQKRKSSYMKQENEKQSQQQNYQIYWQKFQQTVSSSQIVKDAVQNEQNSFITSIMQISKLVQNPFQCKDKDFLIQKEDIIKKLLNFIEFWTQNGHNKVTVIFILQSLKYMVDTEGEEEWSNIKSRQNAMNNLLVCQVCLQLFQNGNSQDKYYLYNLLQLLISMLNGGNLIIQDTVYDYFLQNKQSEKFFRQFSIIINEQIQLVKNQQLNQSPDTSEIIGEISLIDSSMELLQLFCEGHNTNLQNYLRYQKNSKINFDMITIIVQLLTSHKISDKTQTAVQQCLDTLTEIVQGPCVKNQLQIVSSNFLEFAIDILREDHKIFKTKIIDNPDKEDFKNKQVVVVSVNKVNLARIKHKCLLTILSLLELSEQDEIIINRIRRAIPLQVLTNNLIDVYKCYYKHFKDYGMHLFKRANKQIIPLKTKANRLLTQKEIQINIDQEEKDAFIIEIGFNTFILINLILENSKLNQLDNEQLDIYQLISELTAVQDKESASFLEKGVIGDFIKLGKLIYKIINNILRRAAQKALSLAQSEEEREKNEKKLKMLNKQKEDSIKKDAFKFFCENTVHIEFVRKIGQEENLTQCYFPLLPFCKQLPQETKENFYDEIDIGGGKEKLRIILDKSDYIIKVMRHQENCRVAFKKFFLLAIIADHKSLWENLAFMCMCILQFVILVSYTNQFTPESEKGTSHETHYRMQEPRLFYQEEYDWTKSLILWLGWINIIFSVLVVFLFFVKKAPLIVMDMWKDWWEAKKSKFVKFLKMFWLILHSFFKCFTDFNFLFYTFYMTITLLGLFVHPFFYALLTADFLRIRALKNVVKAIYLPRVDLFFTFMIYLLIQYYFTIIAYTIYASHFDHDDCQTFWKCYLTVFDQTFLNTGAVGVYLVDQSLLANGTSRDDGIKPLQPKYHYENTTDGEKLVIDEAINTNYVGRFFYDFFQNLILVILVINMVAGIIIDTFGALKQKTQEKENKLMHLCFICEIDREKLDKAYESQSGFYQHIKKDHYLWNYVFFKAYIRHKDLTEFTGNETFIDRKLQTIDVSWFPIKRALKVVDDEDIEEDRKKQLLKEINESVDNTKACQNQMFKSLKKKD